MSLVIPSNAPRACADPTRSIPDFVDRLIACDEGAYEELVRLHGPRMLAVAARYLPRPGDAEDALQEAFGDVVRAIGRFKRASSLETWLHRVVVNRALMQLRRRRRKPVVALEESALEGGAASPWRGGPPASAHDVVATTEMRRIVRSSVDALSEAHRSVLLLRDVEALPLRDIASLLDVGLSTVKTRLHRARHALQRVLGPRLSQWGA